MNAKPKGGWDEIVGRTIETVVVVARQSTPKHQVHLVFTDGSTFEIYSNPCEGLAGSNRLARGDLASVLSGLRPGPGVHVFMGAEAGGREHRR